MAKYKKTRSITMKETDYPDAVKAANIIAADRNGNVHDVVQDVLVAEAEKINDKTQLAEAG